MREQYREAYWSKYHLYWYILDSIWTCGKKKSNLPEGYGYTKDEAFFDFIDKNNIRVASK